MGAKVPKLNLKNKLKNLEEIRENEKIKYGEIDQFFYEFDENKDNYINENELISVINNYIKVHPEKEENLREMIEGLDMNANSLISLETYRILMMIYINDDVCDTSSIIDIFKFFDKNCNRSIDASEISHVFTKLGLNITKEEANELIKEANIDGEEGIDLDEFAKLMLTK